MAGTLSEKLIPRLLARFPSRGLRIHNGKHPAATFPAAHPEVEDLSIDDAVELTIAVGRLTHGRFSPSNYAAPQDERGRGGWTGAGVPRCGVCRPDGVLERGQGGGLASMRRRAGRAAAWRAQIFMVGPAWRAVTRYKATNSSICSRTLVP